MNSFFRSTLFQLVLFVVTCVTTTLAGAEWIYGRYFFQAADGNIGLNSWLSEEMLLNSLNFSVPFLLILTVHEFGHYYVAKHYKVRVTLPYYIPFWTGIFTSIGTMGAFIKIQQAISSRKHFFDIGIAGPLAGFIVTLIVLWYGFTHLPPQTYIFSIHPEYMKYGLNYAQYVYQGLEGNFYISKNLIFYLFETFVADPDRIPNRYEMMHYPILFAGYLSCFFTALNLIPIGQLDGGHILYGMLGAKKHRYVSFALYVLFVSYAGLGMASPYHFVTGQYLIPLLYLLFLQTIFIKIINEFKTAFLVSFAIFTLQCTLLYFYPDLKGYNGWLLFAFILGRFLGIYHPEAPDKTPLSIWRIVLGLVSLAIFIVCFTPTPFVFE